MSVLAKSLKRLLPVRNRPRSAEAYFTIVRDEVALARTACLLAHYGNRSAVLTEQLLRELWALDTTALYIQLDRAEVPANLVLTRHAGHRVVATGQGFREETETLEPSPNGSYLTERQYRQLGFYQSPPVERTLVLLRMTAGSGRTYLVDVPAYVSHVTFIANARVIAAQRVIPEVAELRLQSIRFRV